MDGSNRSNNKDRIAGAMNGPAHLSTFHPPASKSFSSPEDQIVSPLSRVTLSANVHLPSTRRSRMSCVDAPFLAVKKMLNRRVSESSSGNTTDWSDILGLSVLEKGLVQLGLRS
ncbi:MAG: hypothetical protein JWP89_6467 [Schlesneria sp.]|nr:hypothetical protein [Schlesneria sp.]